MKIKSNFLTVNLKYLALVLALLIPMVFLFGVKSSNAASDAFLSHKAPVGGSNFIITWHGQRVRIRLVKNVTVEKDRCHRLVGMGINFRTNNSKYRCLNGKNLKVWVDLRWPGFYVVHNGMQGSQCVYGTWLFKSLR